MSVRANIEPLVWDSEFFHLSCARLEFDERAKVLAPTDLNVFQLVQAKVPAHQLALIDGLSALGFSLAEGEIDLEIKVGMEHALIPSPEDAFNVVVADASHISLLREAASAAFRLSRFRTPWYHEQDSERFYALWVEKAVLGTFDHQCLLVQDASGHPMGFVTLRDLGSAEARIGLLAAWPGCSGKGIGSRLMQAAKRWCADKNITLLKVATQTGNVAAQRLYIRCGATVSSTAYWLYRGLP